MLLKGKDEPADTPRTGNRLIGCMPSRQRTIVLAQCDRVELAVGTALCEAGEPFEYAYFPITGSISLISALAGHQPLETESIGNEGMLGASLILDINRAPQHGSVQTPCLALRMPARELRKALQNHPALFRILQRYLYLVLAELLQSTGCIRFHDVGMRLARGLLLAHDRARADQLPLTHQLLADMLGVQRGAVTLAAIKLQQDGVIRYSRGKISILDRNGLEAAACGCYRANIETQASFLF